MLGRGERRESQICPYIFWANDIRSRYSVIIVRNATRNASTCNSIGAFCGVSKMISNGSGSISFGAASTPS